MKVDLLGAGAKLRASGSTSGTPSVINATNGNAEKTIHMAGISKVAVQEPLEVNFMQRKTIDARSNAPSSPSKVPMNANLIQHLVQNRNYTGVRPTELPKVS